MSDSGLLLGLSYYGFSPISYLHEARLTPASHISHSSRPVWSCLTAPSARLCIISPPPYLSTTSTLYLSAFYFQKRTASLKACNYPLTAYWDASDHFDSCSLILLWFDGPNFPIMRYHLRFPPGARSQSFPHLDKSRCHIRRVPSFSVLCGKYLFQNKKEHLALEHLPRRAAKTTSCMQRQLSRMQICDLIPLPRPPTPPPRMIRIRPLLGCWTACLA